MLMLPITASGIVPRIRAGTKAAERAATAARREARAAARG